MTLAFLPPVPRREEPELIDYSIPDRSILARNLADLRRVNRWLGGTWLTLRALDRLTVDWQPGAEISILDVATGSADLPEAMVAWAARRGLRIRLIASDLAEQILGIARGQISTSLELLVADGRSLPLPNRGVDVATCSLVLHHLGPEDAVELIHDMWRVARHGIVVNDLVRSRLSYWAARLLCQLFSANPLTRHDGPLSVLRSYTPYEIEILAGRAGVDHLVRAGDLGYRISLYARRPRHPDAPKTR